MARRKRASMREGPLADLFRSTTDDDPDRSVPNPAKRRAHQQVQAAYAREQREKARAEAALLAARTPAKGTSETAISNRAHNAITGPWGASWASSAPTAGSDPA